MRAPTSHRSLYSALKAGLIKPTDAVDTLIADGHGLQEAQETVFLAIGGSDLVEVGEDGVERYFPSGKTVPEIGRLMGI